MEYIVLFLIMLNMTLFFSNVFNKKFEQTIIMGIVMCIFVLFCFGLFSLMNIGFILLLVINVLMFGYNLFLLWKKKIDFKNNVFTIGFILFVLSYLLIMWNCVGRLVSTGDEFSHWGLVVKNMYDLNTLKLGGSSTVMFDYLSGTSMFQYFCVKLSGYYNESMIFIGQNLLIVALFLPVVSMYKDKKSVIPYLLYFLLGIVSLIFYPAIFNSLYVDGVLGIAFAYTLYSYFIMRDDESDCFKLINLCCSLLLLTFIKTLGFYLAIGAWIIILLDNIFVKNKFEFKNFIKKYKWLLLTIVPAIIVNTTWSTALDIWDAIEGHSMGNAIINIFKNGLLPYQKTTIVNFIDALGRSNVSSANFSINCCIILGVGIFFMWLGMNNSKKENKGSVKLFSNALVIGFCLFIVFQLVVYITRFSEYEAVRLASFRRYIGSYIVAMLSAFIVINMCLLKNKSKESLKLLMGLFVPMLFLFDFQSLIDITLKARISVENTLEIREEYIQMADIVDDYADVEDDVFFIATNTTGINFWMARYELSPIKVQNSNSYKDSITYMWSIGVPYYEGDIWTFNISSDDWKQLLIDEYEYVYLFKVDEQFIDIYGDLFDNEIQEKQLYKVISNDNELKLELLS